MDDKKAIESVTDLYSKTRDKKIEALEKQVEGLREWQNKAIIVMEALAHYEPDPEVFKMKNELLKDKGV